MLKLCHLKIFLNIFRELLLRVRAKTLKRENKKRKKKKRKTNKNPTI